MLIIAVAFVLCAGYLSLYSIEYMSQAKKIRLLRQQGVAIDYASAQSWALPFTRVRLIDCGGAEVSHEQLLNVVRQCVNIEELLLVGIDIHDDDLVALSDLSHLQVMVLAGTNVSGDGLRYLSCGGSLKFLSLDYTPCRIESLDILKKFNSLYWLSLNGTEVDNNEAKMLVTRPDLSIETVVTHDGRFVTLQNAPGGFGVYDVQPTDDNDLAR